MIVALKCIIIDDFLSWFETVLIIILNEWVLQGLALAIAVTVPVK